MDVTDDRSGPTDTSSTSLGPDQSQDIVRRRKDLRGAMLRLEAAISRSRKLDDWHRGVEEALASLADALQRHREEVESGDGLLNQIVARAPHLTAASESLRDEHRELEEMIWAAQAVAGTVGVDPSQVRGEALEIINRLVNHRQLGADLLYDTYSLDFGGDH